MRERVAGIGPGGGDRGCSIDSDGGGEIVFRLDRRSCCDSSCWMDDVAGEEGGAGSEKVLYVSHGEETVGAT